MIYYETAIKISKTRVEILITHKALVAYCEIALLAHEALERINEGDNR